MVLLVTILPNIDMRGCVSEEKGSNIELKESDGLERISPTSLGSILFSKKKNKEGFTITEIN